MASSYSALKIELIATGEQVNVWGATTNTNLGTALEEAIVGRAVASFTTDGNLTIDLTNTNSTQVARHYVLSLTSSGALTATRDLIVPTIEKTYVVHNDTAGSQSIRVKTSGGTGITIPNGKKALLYVDGTNVIEQLNYLTSAEIGTITFTNPVPIASGGTNATSASAARTSLGLAIGTNVQAYNAGLQDISGLAKTDGNFIVGDGTNWVAESGATVRTSLGLGSMAVQNSNAVSISAGTATLTSMTTNSATITGGTITGITDLAVADGGTGSSSLTLNSVLIGNGTGALLAVAPSTSGNLLTSNGTTWASTAPATPAPPFASGTRMSFQQTAAPTGWTKDTTAAINDSILRFVTGSVTPSGGSVAFSTWNAQTVTGGTTLTIAQMPAHTHGYPETTTSGAAGASSGRPVSNFVTVQTQSTGGSGSHDHPLTQNIKFYDFIIAAKD
jgi:hypothetical protein